MKFPIQTKKYVIYTAICGDKDNLHPPDQVFPDTDYIAFVDRKHKTSIWKQYDSLSFSLDQSYCHRRNAKIYKILPHFFMQGWETSIWKDPTHEIIVSPESIEQQYLNNNDIALFKHSERNCIFQEAKAVIDQRLDDPGLVKAQIAYYQETGYPKNNGLYELPVIVTKNTPQTRTLGLSWWETICKYSSRDQLSLPYVLWKLQMEPAVCPGNLQGAFGTKNRIAPFRRGHKRKRL